MELTRDQVRAMARAVDLTIPDDELDQVMRRLAALLTAMEEIEREIGDEMDEIDPIPPVFPVEDF